MREKEKRPRDRFDPEGALNITGPQLRDAVPQRLRGKNSALLVEGSGFLGPARTLVVANHLAVKTLGTI